MTKTMNFVKISVVRLFEHVVFYFPEKRLFVCQKRSFSDILERKEWPLDQKIEVKKKKTTIDSFPKALVNKFCPKWNFFSSVFFKEIMLIFWI